MVLQQLLVNELLQLHSSVIERRGPQLSQITGAVHVTYFFIEELICLKMKM
jgi:hypothetical protein